jgi:hypothetical protein
MAAAAAGVPKEKEVAKEEVEGLEEDDEFEEFEAGTNLVKPSHRVPKILAFNFILVINFP